MAHSRNSAGKMLMLSFNPHCTDLAHLKYIDCFRLIASEKKAIN